MYVYNILKYTEVCRIGKRRVMYVYNILARYWTEIYTS